MNKIATTLLGLTALVTVGAGVILIIFWLSGPEVGGGVLVGVSLGGVVVGAGVGVGAAAWAVWRDQRWGWTVAALGGAVLILLAYIVWSTAGPPPLPVPLTEAMAVIGLALVGLVIARLAGRAAP